MSARRPASSTAPGRVPALVLAALALAGAPAAARANPLETAIKATFLYKFAAFVDWPDRAFPSPNSPVTICVVGKDPLGPTLDRAVNGQRLGARPITVRRVARLDAQSGCQILYAASPKDSADALKAAHGAPILTVTDAMPDGVDSSGGIIQFVVRENHVRFYIDEAQAQGSGLSINAKLLSLAVSVKGRS
ncbi:MAG: YfiR family protein [Caulobacteraceae bacterium]